MTSNLENLNQKDTYCSLPEDKTMPDYSSPQPSGNDLQQQSLAQLPPKLWLVAPAKKDSSALAKEWCHWVNPTKCLKWTNYHTFSMWLATVTSRSEVRYAIRVLYESPRIGSFVKKTWTNPRFVDTASNCPSSVHDSWSNPKISIFCLKMHFASEIQNWQRF